MIPDGRIVGPQGWVFTADNWLLTDCTWPYRSAKILPQTFNKSRVLRGVCLNIASDWATANYSHFLADSLGRYGLFALSGIDPNAIDYIYAPKPDSPRTWNLMRRLGIPMDKCIWAQEEPHIKADMVIEPSFPGSRHNYPKFLADFVRGARLNTDLGPKRIYVPRGNFRTISNEAEILGILREHSFTSYDWTTAAGYEFFANADIVVGPHGAGMANAAFCKPGTDLLDLIPSDHAYPFFYTLATSGQLNYSYIMGTSEGSRPTRGGVSPYNFWVDPLVLRAAVEALVERRQSSAD